MDLADALDALAALRQPSHQGASLLHQQLTLLWAVEYAMKDGTRLSRWSQARTELADTLEAGDTGVRRQAEPAHAVLALLDSPLWEIRASTPPSSTHSSQHLDWLNHEDPEFGVSAPAFDLLQNSRHRERFKGALRSLLESAAGASGVADAFWEIEPGVVVVRRDVHARYGGRRQGGIGPSRVTPNVLIFTDPVRGRTHGYFDGWGDDGCFHYTGEGQLGDQQMVQGNLAILRHRDDGRALRLFRAVKEGIEYVGPFEVDPENPWYTGEAPETNGGPLRTVIIFRLRPQGLVQPFNAALPTTPTATSRVTPIPIEASNTEQYEIVSPTEPTTAFRREAALTHSYAEHLRSLGHEVCRNQIVPPHELRPLFTDLYDATAGELIEAKGTVTREAIRMGAGQLLDYQRFIEPLPRLTLLVPSKPRQDLLNFCSTLNISVVWKTGKDWQRL